MLRIQPIANANEAEKYYARSDSGYYYQPGDTRQEWFGRGAEALGLSGTPQFEQFRRLIHGLDPRDGTQLTAKLIEDRIPGVDVNLHCPKGVSTAINRGDARLMDAFWAAAHEAIADMEGHAATRVRRGGKQEDRATGNLVGYGVGHHEGRPAKDDNMPDWHEHLHIVVFNLTRDAEEGRWKAAKFRPLIDQRKLFDRRFNQRFARKVADLGYEVETLHKPDGRGGRKYKGWDIKGIPASVIGKFSRRSEEIDALEAAIVAEMKGRDADAPDRLGALAKDKLGATSRQKKRKDMTLADYREYWDSRITAEEGREIEATIARAWLGRNPEPGPLAASAMEYAIAHHFQRSSVVDFDELAITAMERSMGGALPDDFRAEAARQGALFQGPEVTTRAVWEQEQRIIGFARAGKGVFAPVGIGREDGLASLSAEQRAAVRHVWHSADQLMLIRGGAGTGKTTMMTLALARLGAPAVLLAPSADASRTTLRKEGFADADTVAAFLGDEGMQGRVRGGGIIWVDEAGLLAVDDLDRLCSLASSLSARIVLQGDPRQHKAVDRHGNMLNVLEDFAALPVARLTTIQRQKGDYAGAVAAIRDGELEKGDAVLRKLGWVVEGDGHDALVAEYARAIEERRPDGSRKSVLVVDPTHRDGEALTEELRAVRKAKGLIAGEERAFARLAPLGWTDAEKGDAGRYDGSEVVQFHRNSGAFKAGDRVKAAALLPHLAAVKPGHFAVYREGEVAFAVGDTVRITGNGRDASGRHRVDNGRIDVIRAFTARGDLVLANGWVVDKAFGHFKHGLVQTSPATQSKTEDIVLAAMNRDSLGAMGAEQGYVTVSRGRERGMIFTDLGQAELIRAISRGDTRRSASELMRATPAPAEIRIDRPEDRMRQFMEKVRSVYRQWQRKAAEAIKAPLRQREAGYGRG